MDELLKVMETVLGNINGVVVGICQALAMLVISIGIIKAMWIFLKDVLTPGRSAEAIRESRLELGHSFSLALGFLIGASILKTTFAPTWDDIGQLAAIIAVRTILNYFLLYDIATQAGPAPKPGRLFGALFHRRRPDSQAPTDPPPPPPQDADQPPLRGAMKRARRRAQ